LWILAHEQDAGRGRRGRAWASPRGNLYASALLTESMPAERASLLGLAVALAVADAMEDAAPEARGRLALKWPNDVLASGAKIAGILIEAETEGSQTRLVIGVGVNCLLHPTDLPYPAASLRGLGAEATAADLFHALSARWAEWLATWRLSSGFARIREAWLDRATGLGGPITVRLPDSTLEGTFEDLDRQGRLILKGADGVRKIIGYGEVFLGAPARADI
jgi:BirA family biotin operon repressor/biotin-[acetyl-CoA-carboxylase] ligase